MDNEDFEQFQFSADVIGNAKDYLSEGQTVDVLVFNNQPVSIALPSKVTLEVSSAPEGIKGNTSGAATKAIILETGLQLRSPMFIKSGDKIKVNTETGEYVERI